MPNRLDQLRARMVDLSLQEVDKDFTGMIYGGPGAGKTTLSMTLAQELALGDPILFLDSADGWVSLADREDLTANTQMIRLESGSDLAVIVDALSKKSKGFEDFKVVVIDEHSSIAQWVLEDVVRDKMGLRPDEDLPEFEGSLYGVMTNIVASQLRNLKKVEGLHIILVAHSREKTDRRQVTTIKPEYSPLLLSQTQKLMHVTAYMSSEITAVKGKPVYSRKVQSQPSGLVLAKSRISHMPVVTDTQTWTDTIVDWVYGELLDEGVPAEEDFAPDTLAEDIPPTDGLPASELAEDDEPAYVGE